MSEPPFPLSRLVLPLYAGLTTAAGLVGWPLFYWHLRRRGRGESFAPRLGGALPEASPADGRPHIWLHGVSVGEIGGAGPLVRQLRSLVPEARVFISTSTETGQAVARQLFPEADRVFYFPLDLPWTVHRYLNRLRPTLFVALETEIWPNFINIANNQGVVLALANARLSDRSSRRYGYIQPLFADLIHRFGLIAASSSEDARRFLELGADPSRVRVTGSTKFDRLADTQTAPAADRQRRLLRVQGAPVFLAGSTHPGEEEILIATYQSLRAASPTLLFILAPRHPERAPEVGRMLARAGLEFQLWTSLAAGEEIRTRPVVLVNTVGELFSLYGQADVVFVGGSLVPHGGQNILEPAAWGKAPLYGPQMHNFRPAVALLEAAGAGGKVSGPGDLLAQVRFRLTHREEREALGDRAREALERHQGAARRQAELLAELIR